MTEKDKDATIAELKELLAAKDKLLEKYRLLVAELTGENVQDEPLQQKSP